MGLDEPYWQSNTSFSPLPSRWDFQFQSEGHPYSLQDGIQLYESSTSSDGKDSRGLVSGNYLYNMPYSASDGPGIFLSNSSDSKSPQWMPPAIQEISIPDYETATRKDPSLSQIFFTPNKEVTSENLDSGDSASSQSDSSESESATKSSLSSRKNFSKHCSFITKHVLPLSFPNLTTNMVAFEPADAGFSEFDASNPLRDAQHWSSASSSLDSADVCELFESETSGCPRIPSDGPRCSLCERFLSHRSPWSSRRIVRSRDMPTTGVLPCCHTFHAECLERATPKTHKNYPPCPLCIRLEGENSFDQQDLSRLRNDFPRLRPFCEDGDGRSRSWASAQAGGCVVGALHAPPCNAMFLHNRNRSRKNLSLKDNLSKESHCKVRKSGPFSLQLFGGSSAEQEAVGCSKVPPGPSLKRLWEDSRPVNVDGKL
ncbi:uncharacterized protein LOC113858332 isoform X1 [Abrus precatorius]|uniref:Uncharacterized protein LOC113858332 isoform X1 n=1 Tax=Abrus precatorius TaxID=3816 RepID=A0A8B8KS81_ABRPR|nr:uncharacterized protein LOC113858332 isoform X1 [Abrus precatorius]